MGTQILRCRLPLWHIQACIPAGIKPAQIATWLLNGQFLRLFFGLIRLIKPVEQTPDFVFPDFVQRVKRHFFKFI